MENAKYEHSHFALFILHFSFFIARSNRLQHAQASSLFRYQKRVGTPRMAADLIRSAQAECAYVWSLD